jgi:hypothetical protein
VLRLECPLQFGIPWLRRPCVTVHEYLIHLVAVAQSEMAQVALLNTLNRVGTVAMFTIVIEQHVTLSNP